MPKYVIVGGSAGGIGAVEAIREVDPTGKIAVISEESFPQYSRPMISDLLSREATLEKMKYRDEEFWEKNTVQVSVERRAVTLNLPENYVGLDDGHKIVFEKLLIATGGEPFVPKIDGEGKEGVFTFTTLSDAQRLAEKVEKGKKAVVVGGGLIGVSVAEAMMKRGVEVTIVELKDRILNLLLDRAASDIIEKVIRKAGIEIRTGLTIKRIRGKHRGEGSAVSGVVLTNDEEIPCDLVVIAIGVVPRTELVAGTEIKINRGIIVDRFMQTSSPDVYACGDVAEAYDFVSNENRLLQLWPVAHLGGRVAGYNMAGKRTEYPGGTAMSALKYFDLPIISAGTANPTKNDDYEILVHHDLAENVYKKIVLKDNVIVGVILVNDIERSGTIFYLMQKRIDVSEFKQQLISEDFSLAALPSPLRKKMFMGGVG